MGSRFISTSLVEPSPTHLPVVRDVRVLVTVTLLAVACGSGQVGTTGSAAERIVSQPRPGFPEVEVVADEYTFQPEVIELRLADLVNIVLINEGDEPHDFSIDAPGIHTHPNHPG